MTYQSASRDMAEYKEDSKHKVLSRLLNLSDEVRGHPLIGIVAAGPSENMFC